MRNLAGLGVFAVFLAACTNTSSAADGTSAAATTVLCSSIAGPIVSGTMSSTVVDAGEAQECQPGGKCMYLSTPPPGPQPGCNSETPLEGGGFLLNCPQPSFVPGWACVYTVEAGTTGP
jgi:hypothetical protein